MDNLKNKLNNAKNGWENMEKKNRITMTVVIGALILFGILYSFKSKDGKYVPLFTNLNYEDAGVIVNDLESKNIKYKLKDDGQTILIDSKKIDRYRLDLASEGNLPDGISGFEIFDDVGLMATDEDRKIMYQRALEGELEKSINSLENVKKSKVHLVMSEKSIFETEETEASGSVVLDLKNNKKISDSTIRGISALVSGAVDNLPEENIKIIDSKGNLLNNYGGGEGDHTTIANRYIEVQEQFERKLENNIMNLLGDVFGRDKLKVSVNADLDFDAEEKTTIEYYDPVLRSEQLRVTGDDIDIQPDDGNIGYTDSNIIKEVTGQGSTYERTKNNEISNETTNKVKAPGEVRRLTTSVVYKGQLSNRQIQDIERVVSAATGYDYERDDQISVVGIDVTQEDLVTTDPENTDTILGFSKEAVKDNLWKIILGLILLLLVIALIIRTIRSRKAKEDMEDELEELEEIYQTYAKEDEEKVEEVEEEDDKEIEVIMDSDEAKARQYAEEHPDLAADLIRAWIKDE